MNNVINKIRCWKNKIFDDSVWDFIVGILCTAFAIFVAIIPREFMILIIPLLLTIFNQIENRMFEIKDLILRMIAPVLTYIYITFMHIKL